MKLKGITWEHPRGYDCVVASSRLYEIQTGVSIEWQTRSLQEFADASIDQLADRYDLIVLDHPHVGAIAEGGALRPLPEPDNHTASMGGSAESYFWNGTCWAYAIDAACQMAAYRSDLTSNLPKTWEDLVGFKGASYKPLTPLLPVDAFDMFMTLVAGNGEESLPYDTDHFVSEQNGLYALGVLKSLYRLGPEEATRMNPIQALELLSTTDDFHCSPCLFGYVNYARPGFRKYPIRYFDLPVSKDHARRRAILGGAGIGVSSRTSEPEISLAFARWLSSEPVQSGVYLENEGQPAHRHTWQLMRHAAEYEGFFDGGWNTMNTAWTRPRAPWFLGFVDDVCDVFPAFFSQDIAPESFLNTLNSLYRAHVRKR